MGFDIVVVVAIDLVLAGDLLQIQSLLDYSAVYLDLAAVELSVESSQSLFFEPSLAAAPFVVRCLCWYRLWLLVVSIAILQH